MSLEEELVTSVTVYNCCVCFSSDNTIFFPSGSNSRSKVAENQNINDETEYLPQNDLPPPHAHFPKSPDRPSEFYFIFGCIGLFAIIGDMGTDIYTAVGNFTLGRYVFGSLTLVPIILPILVHLTSSYYKRQEFLIELTGREDFVGLAILKSGIMDPIMWSINHLRATRRYIDEVSNFSGRIDPLRGTFYKSKQMLQLSIKNEAQLEATLQAALSFFRLIFYYSEEKPTARVVAIISLVFSCISIGRAACSDLVKTYVKYHNKGHYLLYKTDLSQKLSWKLSRLASVVLNTATTLIANVTFVLYWHHWTEPAMGQLIQNEPTISLLLGSILMIIINVIFQVTWGIIASRKFFINDFNLGGCCTFQLWQSWTHYVIRAPLINIFRSANLYYYSLPFFIRVVLTSLNSFSITMVFSPIIYCKVSELYFGLIITFFSCLVISFIFQGLASKFLMGRVDIERIENDDGTNSQIIRLYQLP